MPKTSILPGVVHTVSEDLLKVLQHDGQLLEHWNALTPLARNEWICWITIVKKEETRKEHIQRMCDDLQQGKKRPCCWPGCPHRSERAKKWFRHL